MSKYVWEIDLSHEYTGPKTQFVTYLIERVTFYCERISFIIDKQKLSLELVTEILHDEKIINTLIMILSKPEELTFYEDIEHIVDDFEHDPLEVANYMKKISYFNCDFNWLLVDTINWTGGETFCRNIFGKKL